MDITPSKADEVSPQVPTAKVQQSSLKGQQPSPKGQQSSPKASQSSPKVQQFASKVQQSSPKVQQSSPKVQQFAPKVQQSSPKVQQSSLKVQKSSQKVQESSPKVRISPKIEVHSPKVEITPPKMETSSVKVEAASPKVEALLPKVEPSSPKVKASSSSIEHSSPSLGKLIPKVEHPSPKVEHASPKVEHASPKVEHASPKVELVSPKVEHASPKIELLSPKVELASPKVEPSTPKVRKNAKNFPIEMQADQKRRSSSRSIKRKRFDDEIVEYSMSFPNSRGETHRVGRPRAQSHVPPSTPPMASKAPVLSPNYSVEPPTKKVLFETAGTPPAISTASATHSPPSNSSGTFCSKLSSTTTSTSTMRRGPRTNRKAKRTGRPPNLLTTKDLGRWKPIDDLTLVLAVQQANDLRMIHRGIKFSCKFTLPEIQARWYSILYDSAISRTTIAAIRNLHPDIVARIHFDAPFSVDEEEVIAEIKSTDNPKLDHFQELLEKNPRVLYLTRTAKSLQNHWQLMRQYNLLSDQIIRNPNANEQPLQFSDAEDMIIDGELNDPRNEALEIELEIADRKRKRQIRLLESELSRWNVLVDSIAGVNIPPEFDNQTLAILRGRLVRYLMRSKEITFGRESKDSTVDVDFSLEGPSTKISRRQGTIKLRSNGDFFIANEGRRPIYIDGMPLLATNKARLYNNCVVEVAGLRFVFLVNYELINAIRHESAKTTSQLN